MISKSAVVQIGSPDQTICYVYTKQTEDAYDIKLFIHI